MIKKRVFVLGGFFFFFGRILERKARMNWNKWERRFGDLDPNIF